MEKAWSVHCGQLFADHVLARSPRAPNERDAVSKVHTSPDTVLSRMISGGTAPIPAWAHRLPPVVTETTHENSSQTPDLGNQAMVQLHGLEIAEALRQR